MDNTKLGSLIRALRREAGLKQRELAEALGVTDKAVSKWERGLGCPDVSFLPQLSRLFGVDLEKLLQGDLAPNEMVGGNMKKMTYYKLTVEGVENDWYVTGDHPMRKEDYVSFVAFATGDRLQVVKQYPEWDLQTRIPGRNHGMLLWYSQKQGLLYQLV